MSFPTENAPRVPTEFDEYSDHYTQALEAGLAVSGEGQRFFSEHRVQWVAQCLAEVGHQARRVLDYGCGQGASTSLLLELLGASSAVGLDVSRGLLDVAARSNSDARISFELSTNAVADGSFDVAYVNGVFHHIPLRSRPETIRYIRDSLEPGGFLAFWENNPRNFGTRFVMRRIPFDRDALTLTIREASRLLVDNGFDVLEIDSLFFFPRVLRILRPLEPWLSKSRLGAQYMILCRKSLRRQA